MADQKTKRVWTPPPTPTPMNVSPDEVMFVDIETVPCVKTFDELNSQGKTIFFKRFAKDLETLDAEKVWKHKAALTSEFSKIACISIGIIVPAQIPMLLRMKSFAGRDEGIILKDVEPKLAAAKYLCAHNGKRFDFPLLIRKLIQYKIALPGVLQIIGLKPWEVRLFDTMETWAFNGWDNASLDALAFSLALPSPKTEMSGADVAPLYYGEGELPWENEDAIKNIATYCQGDVLTMANAYLRIIGRPVISPENVVIV